MNRPGRRQVLEGAELAEGGAQDQGRKYRISPYGLVSLQPEVAGRNDCQGYVNPARSIGPQVAYLVGGRFPDANVLSVPRFSEQRQTASRQPREWRDPESAFAVPGEQGAFRLELAYPSKPGGYEGKYLVQPVIPLLVGVGCAAEAERRYFWGGPTHEPTTAKQVAEAVGTEACLRREGASGYERVPEEEPLAALAEAGTLRVAALLTVRVRTARGVENRELPTAACGTTSGTCGATRRGRRSGVPCSRTARWIWETCPRKG